MLQHEVRLITMWWAITALVRARVDQARDDVDRGEVTATTAVIVLLVVAAIAAGGVIAAKIVSNANKVPEPGT
jgi:hypothetical protein